MNQGRPEDLGSGTTPRRSWVAAWLVLGGLTAAATAGYVIEHAAKQNNIPNAHGKAERASIPCELTGEAKPSSHGAGFVLTGQCPGGAASIQPTLSLWMQLIETLPREDRVVIVKCGVRDNGSYTDCRKTNELASNSERYWK
jgi:hypothetical protein